MLDEQRMSGDSAMAVDAREQYFGGPTVGRSPSYRSSRKFDATKIRAQAKSCKLE